jgi:hypothetical protein
MMKTHHNRAEQCPERIQSNGRNRYGAPLRAESLRRYIPKNCSAAEAKPIGVIRISAAV